MTDADRECDHIDDEDDYGDDGEFGDAVRSELTGKAIFLSGHGDYVGKEWPAAVRRVFPKALEICFRDPIHASPVVVMFDRITGWPPEQSGYRANGFRLQGPEIRLLLREEQGRLSYQQLDAAGRTTMSEVAEAPAVEETQPETETQPEQIDLEGFGKNQGRVVQATIVEKSESQVVVAIPNGDKDAIKKTFNLSDGKLEGNVGANGWKIADANLNDLRGVKTKATGNGAKAPTPRTKKELNDCLCGCGAKVKSRFQTGHDAIAHSMIKKGLRGILTEEDLKGRDWVLDQIGLQGGFNTQEAPASARRSAASGTSEGYLNPATGKMLYGAAARALKQKEEEAMLEAAAATAAA